MELLHSDISSTILKGFYTVANALPFGLDKDFYCNALTIELQQLSLKVENNKQQEVKYKDQTIGQFTFDLVVNNLLLVQVSTDKGFIETEQIELSKNYLKLTEFEVLLLLNFGLDADYKRVFLSNNYKNR
jgi:GxxExxY protein